MSSVPAPTMHENSSMENGTYQLKQNISNMFAKVQIATNKLELTAAAVQVNGCARHVSTITWKKYLLATAAAIEFNGPKNSPRVVIVWLIL